MLLPWKAVCQVVQAPSVCDASIPNMWLPPARHVAFRAALAGKDSIRKTHCILNHLSPEHTSLWRTFYWSKQVIWPQLAAREAGKCSLWHSSCSPGTTLPGGKGAWIFVTRPVKLKMNGSYDWELPSQIYVPLRNSDTWIQISCTRLFRAALLAIAKPWNIPEL